MQSTGQRLKKLRNGAGFSQAKVADLVGISDTAYQNYEYDKRDIPGDVLMTLAKLFGVSTDSILGTDFGNDAEITAGSSTAVWLNIPGAKAAKGVKTARVPLVGRAHAGPACEPVVYEEADDWVEIPETYLAIDPECFVMDFEGDCMLPDFGSATSLVISPNSPFGNGSIVVAVVDEVDYVVRRIYQSAKELRLKASNPAYDDIVIPRDSERTVAYKGKALGCFRRFD